MEAPAVPNTHKVIAKYLRDSLGGEPKVKTRWDENESTKIALFEGDHRSEPPLWSFGTIGVSDHQNFNARRSQDVPVELVTTSSDYRMANVMATLAFRKLNDGHDFWPDKIEENVIDIYGWAVACKHILFVDVFSSDIKPLQLRETGRGVHWLEVLPITEKERRFIKDRGARTFTQAIPVGSDAYLRLDRPSYV